VAKYTQISNIPGCRDLQSLLAIIREPKRYEAALSEIDDHLEKANRAIERVGKASQIDALHGQAKNLQLEAAAVLERAKAQADEIVAKAHERTKDVDRCRQEIADASQALTEAHRKFDLERKAHRLEVQAYETSLAELGAREKVATAAQAKADRLQAELSDKLATLKKMASGI
jgi:hypothetical protein